MPPSAAFSFNALYPSWDPIRSQTHTWGRTPFIPLICERSPKCVPNTFRPLFICSAENSERENVRIERSESSEATIERRLVSWLDSNNIELDGIELRRKSEGERAMYASQPIEYGQTLITIPRNSILLIDVYRHSVPNLHVFHLPHRSTFWQTAPWYIRLAVKLLDEFALVEESPFLPYLRALPMNPTSVIWELHRSDTTADDVAEIRSQLEKCGLWPRTDEFIQIVESAHSRLLEALDSGGEQLAVSRSRFFWAVCICISRAFALPGGPQTRSEDDDLVQGWAISTKMLEQKSSSASTKKGMPTEFALIPGLDMINHWTGSNSRLVYNAQCGTYNVQAGSSSTVGEEVFISYGAKGNDELGLFYGVVEALNPASSVHVSGSWLVERVGSKKGNGIGLDLAWGGKRAQLLKRAGLAQVNKSFEIRCDGIDADIERILRAALTTDEELHSLKIADDKELYKRLGKSISLRNELAMWDTLIEWCEELGEENRPTQAEELAVQKLIDQGKGKGPVGVVWDVRGGVDRLGHRVYKWEKSRVLAEAKQRFEHFKKVSTAIGTVCTVLVPPTQSTLRTEVFEQMTGDDMFGSGAGMRTFDLPHHLVQSELDNSDRISKNFMAQEK